MNVRLQSLIAVTRVFAKRSRSESWSIAERRGYALRSSSYNNSFSVRVLLSRKALVKEVAQVASLSVWVLMDNEATWTHLLSSNSTMVLSRGNYCNRDLPPPGASWVILSWAFKVYTEIQTVLLSLLCVHLIVQQWTTSIYTHWLSIVAGVSSSSLTLTIFIHLIRCLR